MSSTQRSEGEEDALVDSSFADTFPNSLQSSKHSSIASSLLIPGSPTGPPPPSKALPSHPQLGLSSLHHFSHTPACTPLPTSSRHQLLHRVHSLITPLTASPPSSQTRPNRPSPSSSTSQSPQPPPHSASSSPQTPPSSPSLLPPSQVL